MDIGSLNRRFAIKRRTDGTDDAGQPLLTWELVTKVWADVKGDAGLTTIRNSGNVPAAIKRYSIRIRFRRDVDEGMSAVELVNDQEIGAPFDVKEVRMDYAGREWMDLIAEQGGNDG